MAHVKVKINNPTPSLETIRRYRDFDLFMNRYKKYYTTAGIRHMLYNDRKKLVYIIIIIVFLMLLLFVDELSENPDDKKQSTPVEQVYP